MGAADLRARLDRTLALLRHRIGAAVAIERDYGELPAVECLPGQLDQVLLNVLANAADAVGRRGHSPSGPRVLEPPAAA